MKDDDCHIPLLESVFEAFPNIPINVDIKTNSDVLIDKVSNNNNYCKCEVSTFPVVTSNFDLRTHVFSFSLFC